MQLKPGNIDRYDNNYNVIIIVNVPYYCIISYIVSLIYLFLYTSKNIYHIAISASKLSLVGRP